MRLRLACFLLLCGATLASASEASRLPTFFGESFEAVQQQPLVTFTPAKPDETGTIVGRAGDVPKPPPRPEAGSVYAVSAPLQAAGQAFAVKVPAGVHIADAMTFVVGKDRYALASLDGLKVSQRCVKETNGHCMRRPMRWLKEAIAGQTLQCRHVGGGNGKVVCTK